VKQVYIVHGWTYSLDKWQAVCQELLGQGIEPIMLKVPGLTEPSDKVWDIDGYVDWLDKKLSNVSLPIVVGHSNGGRIALSYAQKYPSKLGKLILIDSAGIPNNEKKALFKLEVLKYLSKLGKIFSYIPPVKKLFYKLIGAQDYNNAPPNMKKTMQNMLHADQLLELATIKLPVTLIWGRDDGQTPLADGQKMHEFISGSTLHIIDDARHAPFFNHPAEVAGIIRDAVEGRK
jgi:pimeloyl-ACP methyl ester carboxylesterase